MSCSVKEDRTGCPCLLTVVSDRQEDAAVCAFIYDLPEKIDEEVLSPAESGIECVVPRKELQVSYVSCPGMMPPENEMYKIPFGRECDSLFASSHVVDCNGETAVDTLRLYKNFCSLVGVVVGGSGFGSVAAVGNVCGVTIPELRLVEGAFRFEPQVDPAGQFRMRLPRQKDGSLTMEFYDDGGKLLWTYPLGVKMGEQGYDWSALNLSDIALAIDVSKFEVLLKIVPWTDGGSVDVTI